MNLRLLILLALSCPFTIKALQPQVPLDSTTLPLVVISTNGGVIADDPKITVDMKIIFNGPGSYNRPADPGNIYTGKAGIEYRGAYSQSLPQKPYGFETRDDQGNNLNIPLLGMPAENDWILLANYNDKVFMRNTLAFHLFENMGHYAPRTNICEVLINGEYMGIFVLTEKIKRDRNRLDIAKLDADDNAGDSLSGGYVFATDYYDNYNSWTSNFMATDRSDHHVHFVYKYPEPEVITSQQKNYIQAFVNTLETKLYGSNFRDATGGYRDYMDVNSFIDYFIIGEVSRNVDAYKKSCFYHKDRDDKGGLLHAGPVWDFDWAWKNIYDNCYIYEVTDGSNWAYRVNECNNWPVVPSWIKRLMEDPSFRDELHERYTTLRQSILSEEYLDHYIDSVQTLVNKAQQRHYQRWPILGQYVGSPEVDPPAPTFAGEIAKFRNWIKVRLAWLDANMPDSESTSIREKETEKITFRLFPNPVRDILYIESGEKMLKIEVFNSSGYQVQYLDAKDRYSVPVDVSNLHPGLYVVRCTMQGQQTITARFVVEK
ncbi:MAG TPA: CotH kinase family protein [Bacteroidales bacterium]|nr:CotH kinase family protein [Bacteroidales bacterium]